jgi:hypothetical protein
MTDVIEIGKEQAIALLERAVQEKGADYQYSRPRGRMGLPVPTRITGMMFPPALSVTLSPMSACRWTR